MGQTSAAATKSAKKTTMKKQPKKTARKAAPKKSASKPPKTSKSSASNGKSTTAKGMDAKAQAGIKIGQTFKALESAKEAVSDTRKEWREKVNAAEATFRGAAKSDDDGTIAAKAAKCDRMCGAFQDLEEAEAGRKDALSIVLEKRKELAAKLKRQIDGANQLDLF